MRIDWALNPKCPRCDGEDHFWERHGLSGSKVYHNYMRLRCKNCGKNFEMRLYDKTTRDDRRSE
ncbi:unnamed protein product [marine sediment metagenome]|uniref:Uncharacterized protein n=1 Tax=marine sediment metagenome TaxID=412755 RepID=X1GQ23_9ZZZZ